MKISPILGRISSPTFLPKTTGFFGSTGGSKQLREVKCLRIFDGSDESPELCSEYPEPPPAMTCECLGGETSNILLIFTSKLGEDEPILTNNFSDGLNRNHQPGVMSYPATPTWRIFVLQLLLQDVLQRQVMMIFWSWAALKSQLSMVHLASQHLYMIGHVWIIREPVHAEVVWPSIPCGPMLWFQHFVLSFVSVRVWTSLRWWMAWSVDVVHQL